MEVVSEELLVAVGALVVDREVGDLLSVHARGWDFDWTCEVKVVVA